MIGEKLSRRTKIALLKVKGGMSCEVVCLADEPLGFRVHWLGKRSFMCPGVDCAADFAGVGSRWWGVATRDGPPGALRVSVAGARSWHGRGSDTLAHYARSRTRRGRWLAPVPTGAAPNGPRCERG